MYKLFEIIKKNFRLLIRSKTSALIVLVGPLLLMLFVGLAFNSNSLFDIKIGTYSPGYNELAESLITQLEDDEYSVIKIETEEECILGVKNQDVQVCAIIPDSLAVQGDNAIVFYVDKSRMNLVGSILQSISSKVTIKSSELSTALTGTLISTIEQVQNELLSKGSSISALSGNIQAVQDMINSISSDLAGLDLSAGNQSDFDVKSDNFTSENNLSGGVSSDYEDIIKLAKDKIKDASSKLSAVEDFRSKTTNDLIGIQDTLNSYKDTGEELSQAVQTVQSNVDSIEVTDVSKIVNPLKVDIRAVAEEGTHLTSTFPTLLVLVLLFAGVFIASTMVIEEKSDKAFFRNFITPTSDAIFLIGDYLSNLLILMIQLGIIFLVMVNIVPMTLNDTILTNLVIILLLLSSIFILIGMLIGYIFKSEETANIAAISVSGVLLFFSNTILPIETLPTAIRGIVKLSPFVLGEAALKRTLIFGQGLEEITGSFYILVIYVAVLICLVYGVRELTKRNAV